MEMGLAAFPPTNKIFIILYMQNILTATMQGYGVHIAINTISNTSLPFKGNSSRPKLGAKI